MNLISILSEIKVVPAKSAGGLVPGDLVSFYFRNNFYNKNDPNRVELTIVTIDKVKETPMRYRIWRNKLKVYFYPETKTYEVGEIEPYYFGDKGELYDKDYDHFKDRNDLSKFSLDSIKKDQAEVAFKENKIDLKALAIIVDAFYRQYYSSNSMDFAIKSSKEELFKKASEELKQTEDLFVKVKDKVAEDNLDWIEPIALDLIQKYSNADMSTYIKS